MLVILFALLTVEGEHVRFYLRHDHCWESAIRMQAMTGGMFDCKLAQVWVSADDPGS